MEIFEKYASEILFEQPIKYLGIITYPVLMEDVFKFYKCSGILLLNPLDFNDPKVASMSYLDLVINISLIQEDFQKNFIEMLCLVMRIEESDIKIESEGSEEERTFFISIRQNDSWKKINGGMFTKIKNLICYQNGLEVQDLKENQEIARAKKALAQMGSQGNPPTLQDQIYSVSTAMAIDVKEIKKWSIKRFNETLKACDRLIHYKIYRAAEMGGMVSFKNGSPIKTWLKSEDSTEGKMRDIKEVSSTFGNVIS